ncbi:hypothetical protein Pelo_19822 [Pelomyxa schiedti]|nr:hypothetical protein Pelo_19822 [Pelomyxa schiedti]
MRVIAEGPGVEVDQISDSHVFISKTTEHEALGTIWDYSGMSHATPPLVTLLKEADLGFIFVVQNVLDPRLDVVDPSSQMTVLTVTFPGWKPLWMSLLFSV